MMQAMIPRRIKERLKPWQVDGLRHLFDTIILDHDSELWRKHRQEVAAARAANGGSSSQEADDAPCHAGGAILAQVRLLLHPACPLWPWWPCTSVAHSTPSVTEPLWLLFSASASPLWLCGWPAVCQHLPGCTY